MTKTCEVCGAEFEPRYNMQKRQKSCSKACSRELVRRWYLENKTTDNYKQRVQANYWHKNADRVKCKICGGPVLPLGREGRRAPFHEHCVVKDCLSTLRRFERLSKTQLTRIYNLGLTVGELRDMLAAEAEA